jgi:glycosyltransferase involved in cell wall biosynthesis
MFSKPAICLTMIVKNESVVLRRCLESVRDIISAYVIVDTGSDPDQLAIQREIAAEVFAGIPGQIVERPWVNFAHNRSESLKLGRDLYGWTDYLFVMDADDVLVPHGVPFNPTQDFLGDAAHVSVRSGSVVFDRL